MGHRPFVSFQEASAAPFAATVNLPDQYSIGWKEWSDWFKLLSSDTYLAKCGSSGCLG
jgi:hypothetical protein